MTHRTTATATTTATTTAAAAALLLWALLSPTGARGADEPPAAHPAFSLEDPARILAGRKRFGSTCAAYCHGAEGEGGKTPKFKGKSDFMPAEAFKVITEGRTGTDVMPPWGKAFTPEQIWELVAYLQYLSRQPASE